MKILAIESSASAASVAVTSDERLLGQYFQNTGLTHSRTLLKMAEDLLRNTELTLSDIDLIAVASGPGSFPGVRIGVAAVKGLCWGADKPVCGVSTLRAMAFLPQVEGVIICPVMDARRAQVYNALFEYKSGALTRLCDDRAISVSELIAEAQKSALPYYLIGDGAEMCKTQFDAQGVTCVLAPLSIRQQTAYGVALASLGEMPADPNDLTPNYLRKPQAERERESRG
jgi:tRNA threonylcarbamoyladenosine biosynthesis protein TsaB